MEQQCDGLNNLNKIVEEVINEHTDIVHEHQEIVQKNAESYSRLCRNMLTNMKKL